MIARSSVWLVLLAAVLVAVPRPAAGGDEERKASSPAKTLAAMTWLGGTWRGKVGAGTFEAYYSTPEGGKILSFSELTKEGKTLFHEFEVFSCDEKAVHLQPYPGGKPAAAFRLASADAKARKAVFDSPENDFPSRITYHRVADDNLVITLTDPHGGKEKVQRFDLKRAGVR